MASLLIELLILSPVGDEFLMMFYITGGCSCISLILLIFIFNAKRFEPNWELVYKTEEVEKNKVSMLKVTRSKSY